MKRLRLFFNGSFVIASRIVKRKALWHGLDSTARKNRSNMTIIHHKLFRVESTGVAKLRVNKVFDMRLIIREGLLVKLPAVERKHEQF